MDTHAEHKEDRSVRQEIRGELRGIVNEAQVGHDGDAICLLADKVVWKIEELHQGPLPSRHQREPLVIELPARDWAARWERQKAHGIDAMHLRSARFDGTWCVWSHRAHHADHQVLATGAEFDPNGALWRGLERVLHGAERDVLTTALTAAVWDWEATFRGQTTERTLQNSQILSAAAQDTRHHGGAVRRLEPTRTWSMWVSKGHPDDRRLVITRTALDALSFAALQPDASNRTRYISFDGERTPTREVLLDRAIAMMPAGSRVVMAPDRSELGADLERSVQGLRRRYTELAFERHTPTHDNWNRDLREHGRLLSRLLSPPEPSMAGAERPRGLDR